MQVILRATDKHGYYRDLYIADDQQERMRDARVVDGVDGIAIDAAEFPEAVRLELVIKR